MAMTTILNFSERQYDIHDGGGVAVMVPRGNKDADTGAVTPGQGLMDSAALDRLLATDAWTIAVFKSGDLRKADAAVSALAVADGDDKGKPKK